MDIAQAYKQTVDYLYTTLPMFSSKGKEALKPGLDNIRKLCKILDDPQEQFKSIHIAGTNGKGSVSHMLAAILQEAGYKVGLYTSPHLVDFRERIRIDGVPVSREWVVDIVERLKPVTLETVQPSFFELTVAMAFTAFAEEKVDVAIVETGLGGRLDSTNIITPLLSVITNISYDHKDTLGNTLGEIAAEKAGIIKPQVPVVIGQQHPETERIFFEHALRNQATVYYAEAMWDMVRVGQNARYQYFKAVHRARREMHDLSSDLLGSYQQYNLRTALAAVEVLLARQEFSALTVDKALTAFAKVKRLTGLRGRWEILQQQPLIISDVAHNAAGIQEVVKQWEYIDASQKHILIGFVKDKDVTEALSCFPKDAIYHFCNARIPRALPVAELAAFAADAGLQGTVYSSVQEAVDSIRGGLGAEDALLITGSFFVVGEAMEHLMPEAVQSTFPFPGI
jgi:dihydrofolate synthase/folylpolyglutamate synthase